MKKFLALIALSLSLALTGCGNKPLKHSYTGDVELRSLSVNFQSLEEAKADDKKGMFDTINKIQKHIQGIEDLLDPERSSELYNQLIEFQDILLASIRTSAKLPLLPPKQVVIETVYNDDGELTDLEFIYPEVTGAALDLQAMVYYPSTESLSIGTDGFSQETLIVRPEMQLFISAQTEDDETFWRHSVRYKSKQKFTLGNEYILGVATDRIETGQVFLIPLAQGIAQRLPQTMQ